MGKEVSGGPSGGLGGVERRTWRYEKGLETHRWSGSGWEANPEVWKWERGSPGGPGGLPVSPGVVGSPYRWAGRDQQAHPEGR